MDITTILEQKIIDKKIIKIVYLGGSTPGTVRDIGPISMKNGKVRAKCYLSNVIKTFLIEKIQIMDTDGVLTETNYKIEETQTLPKFNSFEEAHTYLEKQLTKLGWHTQSSSNTLSLHRSFKNGNPMKGSDVMIDYEEYTHDEYYNADGELVLGEQKKRIKPWSVRAKNATTASYSSLEKAMAKFILHADKLAPSKL